MEIEQEQDFDQLWRGCPLRLIHLNCEKFERQHFRAIKISRKKTILYEFPIGVVDTKTPPSPYTKTLKWNSDYVRLPNAIECECPTNDTTEDETDRKHNKSKFPNRWELIKHTLSQTITTVREFEDAIVAYNPEFEGGHSYFGALRSLFEEDVNAEANASEFFGNLLPRIIKLALRMPELIKAPIPLLKQSENHSLSLSQQQVSCLLANAFLCTFPYRSYTENGSSLHDEYKSYSDINFHKLFQATGPSVIEKIKCFLNYFRRVCPTETDSTNVPNGVVTFIRKFLRTCDFPEWSWCDRQIGETLLHVDAAGLIENADGLLQVSFADKFIGGRVLDVGCTQEEIRFATNPELVVSKLFTESLTDNEALFMIGCEQYSSYIGHNDDFKWNGDYIDKTPRDNSKRRQINIVAIDAFKYPKPEIQFQETFILRELNKAYVGFHHQLKRPPPGVATGNWGCGSLGGDRHLKALVQIMAACVMERPLAYYTFFDENLRDDIYKMFEFLKKRKTRVCDLYSILTDLQSHNWDPKKLYKYIRYQIRLLEQRKNYFFKSVATSGYEPLVYYEF